MEKERKRTLNSLRKTFAESESDESFNESDFDDPEPFFIITSNHTINEVFDKSDTDAIKRRFFSYCFDNDLGKNPQIIYINKEASFNFLFGNIFLYSFYSFFIHQFFELINGLHIMIKKQIELKLIVLNKLFEKTVI